MNPFVLLFAGTALGATIRIDAKNLAFEPNVVSAEVGDVLEFHFLPNNHSVVMGDFDDPCQPVKTNGFYSGYHPVESGEADTIFSVVVNNTEPIWLYCSKYGHCSNGMVGVINPTAEQTFEEYLSAAEAFQGVEGEPAAPFGGVLESNAGPTGTRTTTSAVSATHTSTETSETAMATSSVATGGANRNEAFGGFATGLAWAFYAFIG